MSFFLTALAAAALSAAPSPPGIIPPGSDPKIAAFTGHTVLPHTWSDPATGLTWTVCPLGGMSYTMQGQLMCGGDHTTTAGDIRKLPWYDAVAAAQADRTDGFSDWRVPTVDEFRTILKCEDIAWRRRSEAVRQKQKSPYTDLVGGGADLACQPGYDGLHFTGPIQSGDSWTSTTYGAPVDIEPGANKPTVRLTRVTIPTFEEAKDARTTLLVRGGTPSPEWTTAVEEAHQIQERVAALKAGLEQKLKDETARVAAATRQQEAANAAAKRAFQQRSLALQGTVRAGDRVAQGLVVRVRGHLVQVQTPPGRHCRYYSDIGQTCESIPSQLVWLERSALMAPR